MWEKKQGQESEDPGFLLYFIFALFNFADILNREN